eukprot:5066928-Pleurochrysis_carterae.AAC.1
MHAAGAIPTRLATADSANAAVATSVTATFLFQTGCSTHLLTGRQALKDVAVFFLLSPARPGFA